MKIHIYLLKKHITDFRKSISYPIIDEELIVQGKTYLKPIKSKPDIPLIGFQLITQLSSPKWSSFIKENFQINMDITKSRNPGFLIFYQNGNRCFCISFGQAFHGINKDTIENNFGLKVAANAVDHIKLKEIDTKSITNKIFYRKTIYEQIASIEEFNINYLINRIKIIAGYPKNEDNVTISISGSDALDLNLHSRFNIADLPMICDKYFAIFNRDDYKSYFPFIDYFSIIKEPGILSILNEYLIEDLKTSETRTMLSVGTSTSFMNIETIQIKFGRKSYSFDSANVDIKNIQTFISQNHIQIQSKTLEDIKLIMNSKSSSLFECLNIEVDLNSRKYILDCGHWLEVSVSYIELLRKDVDKIDITNKFALKEWKASISNEKEYNSLIEDKVDYFNLDHLTLKSDQIHDSFNKRSEIELCDLLYKPDLKFILVKHYKKSASSISHLFTQAQASAHLYNDYRFKKEELCKILNDKYSWRGKLDLKFTNDPQFVLAIVEDRDGNLSNLLPILAIIGISCTLREYRDLGLDFKITKITKIVN